MYVLMLPFFSDLRTISIFKLLHHLLPPNTRSKFKVAEKSVNWKPSIQDSLNSMFLFVETESSIEEKISDLSKEHKAKSLTLQPIVVILMSNEVPTKFFVRIDGTTYIQHNILAAIDLCFKSFHVFNLAYPRQSHNAWIFIQKFFYTITTAYDKTISSVSSLITELNKDTA